MKPTGLPRIWLAMAINPAQQGVAMLVPPVMSQCFHLLGKHWDITMLPSARVDLPHDAGFKGGVEVVAWLRREGHIGNAAFVMKQFLIEQAILVVWRGED